MKLKREITLGEMQDECADRGGQCNSGGGNNCSSESVCPFHLVTRPMNIDLTDPPRFTEAQMALLRGAIAIGATWIARDDSGTAIFQNEPKLYIEADGSGSEYIAESDEQIWLIEDCALELAMNTKFCLAELLGKDKE